jgi:16S rRNA (adenine1518-N6/adenine1519-N6)-dimethyltransferase
VQSIAQVQRLFNVGAGSFRPAPSVDSAVLRIMPFRPARLSGPEETDLRALTRTLFSQRRKQMQTVLRHAPGYFLSADQVHSLEQATRIDMNARPEQLSPTQFIDLARVLRVSGWPHESA